MHFVTSQSQRATFNLRLVPLQQACAPRSPSRVIEYGRNRMACIAEVVAPAHASKRNLSLSTVHTQPRAPTFGS